MFGKNDAFPADRQTHMPAHLPETRPAHHPHPSLSFLSSAPACGPAAAATPLLGPAQVHSPARKREWWQQRVAVLAVLRADPCQVARGQLQCVAEQGGGVLTCRCAGSSSSNLLPLAATAGGPLSRGRLAAGPASPPRPRPSAPLPPLPPRPPRPGCCCLPPSPSPLLRRESRSSLRRSLRCGCAPLPLPLPPPPPPSPKSSWFSWKGRRGPLLPPLLPAPRPPLLSPLLASLLLPPLLPLPLPLPPPPHPPPRPRPLPRPPNIPGDYCSRVEGPLNSPACLNCSAPF